jgi:hypothetical protein
MTIKHTVIPSPGNCIVVREHVDEYAARFTDKDGKQSGILRTEDQQALEQRINPWALVVGVGAPKITRDGLTIEAPCKLGDKVIAAQVGRYIDLRTPDGEVEYLYVIPFEGVIAKLGYRCTVCGLEIQSFGTETTERTDVRTLSCPNGCKTLDKPTPFQVENITRSR